MGNRCGSQNRKRLLIGAVLAYLLLLQVGAGKGGNDLEKTLASLKKVDEFPLYYLHYYGDYGFEDYLSLGAKDDTELNEFLINRKLVTGRIRGNEDYWACSCFMAKNSQGEVLFGRNFDVPGRRPSLLLYTDSPQGYASISLVELNVLEPFKNPASAPETGSPKIPANILAAPYFPRDGVNEHGVGVATLNVPLAQLDKDPNKATIGRWQVLRLILDHARNVDEAIALLHNYNLNTGSVHYFVVDASGNSAIIEFINGRIEVTRNSKPWDVVTNFIVFGSTEEEKKMDFYYKTAYQALTESNGVISEDKAMGILKDISWGITLWSAVYNLNSKDLYLVMAKQHDQVKKFNLKTVE